MTAEDTYMDANLKSWDERVAIHLTDRSGIYRFDTFFAGDTALTPIEEAELGDIAGLDVAHLQCHFGMDTIRLARRGARPVGLDFSPAAIAQAHNLADRTGSAARFVQANVYDAARVLEPGGFDMVYISWGALYWLPDMAGWARIVAALLKPGGRLYLAEGHPHLIQMEQMNGPRLYHAYSQGSRQRFEEAESYAGDGRALTNRTTFEWMHGLSDILGALIAAGLTVTGFREHATLPWPAVKCMVDAGGGMFRLPDHVPGPPCSFSLDAVKPTA